MIKPDQPPPLPVMEYDTPPRADHVTRRRYQAVVVLAAVFGAVLAAMLLIWLARSSSSARVMPAVAIPAPVRVTPQPPVIQQQQQVAQMWRQSNEKRLAELVADATPPTTIVYTEDPVEARRLFGNGVCNQQAQRRDMNQPFFSAFEPPVFRTAGFIQPSSGNEQTPALLFAHALTSPGGNERLVLLEMDVQLQGSKRSDNEYSVRISRQLNYRVCKPKLFGSDGPDVVRYGTSLKIVQDGDADTIPIRWLDGTLRSARAKQDNLRFFAGQVDPKDASHFTIDYQLGDDRNTIDGWLTDDDFLRVIPRGGKVDKGDWRIAAPPPVAPAAQ